MLGRESGCGGSLGDDERCGTGADLGSRMPDACDASIAAGDPPGAAGAAADDWLLRLIPLPMRMLLPLPICLLVTIGYRRCGCW